MRITSRGLQAVTVGLVSAVVLAGCSSNSTQPTVLPTLQTTSAQPSTTPSAAPATTAAVPTIAPTTAAVASTATPSTTSKADALAGVQHQMEAAVRLYYLAVNDALKSQAATKVMSTLYTSACQQCAQDQQGINLLHSRQETLSGGGYKILAVKAVATDPNGGGVTVTYSVPASVEYDSSGRIVSRFPAHPKRTAGLTVRRVSGKWLIAQYTTFGNVS